MVVGTALCGLAYVRNAFCQGSSGGSQVLRTKGLIISGRVVHSTKLGESSILLNLPFTYCADMICTLVWTKLLTWIFTRDFNYLPAIQLRWIVGAGFTCTWCWSIGQDMFYLLTCQFRRADYVTWFATCWAYWIAARAVPATRLCGRVWQWRNVCALRFIILRRRIVDIDFLHLWCSTEWQCVIKFLQFLCLEPFIVVSNEHWALV